MIDIETNVQRIFNRAGCRMPYGCEIARDTTGVFIVARGKVKTYLTWGSEKNMVRAAAIILERAT